MIHLRPTNPHDGTLYDLLPDFTPMLDIIFILLVFFMLTAGTVFQSLDLTLPSSVTEALAEMRTPERIMLEVRTRGYAIDGQSIDNFDQFRQDVAQLVKQRPGHEVIVAGDKSIPMERFLQVLTYLQSQGVQSANILMQKESSK